jgi:quercetin dioxygenase-like cupin family protein
MDVFADAVSLPPQQIWDGILARTVHSELVTLALLELDPDCVVPEHSHENEQVGLMIRGFATFTVGGETREVHSGGSWRIRANVPHSVVTGPEGAVLVEVFSPIRADWLERPYEQPRPPLWP